MKKYLIIFLTLMMFILVSCSDTQEDGLEPSSSISEQTTEETTTEETTTTEPATGTPTEKEIVLDSAWECDYLTIATCSEWKEKVETEDDEITVTWIWEDEMYHKIWFQMKIPAKNGKMSEEDLQKKYSEYTRIRKVLNSFTKNEQAYIIYSVGVDVESYIYQGVDFSTNDFEGTIEYKKEDEETVMNMINSIEFKEYIATTKTTETTTKVTESTTKKKEKTVYYTPTGSKYHFDSKCGRGEYSPCTLDEALAMGLEPCKKCT